MSHIPQRKEKDCLNCGTVVQGPYCHNCGQENVVPHETFWHMVKHFVYDITHFDGNFFSTLKLLVSKPGFLSKEYIKGRRASYLNPVKMYVFTSAMFFLVFFTFFVLDTNISTTAGRPLKANERSAYIQRLENKLKKEPLNSELAAKLVMAIDTTRQLLVQDTFLNRDMNFNMLSFSSKTYKSRDEYDSLQKLLPAGERDGWFKRRLVKKEIEINNKYRNNPDEAFKKLSKSVLHRLPYMLFVSLPLFALILKLVYIRRKQFYFVDHGIFTIHLYVFTFVLLLLVFLLEKLEKITQIGFVSVLLAMSFIGLFFYLYKAMRNFYGQRRAKTVLKFVLVVLCSLLMMLLLFLGFTFFSAFTF